MKVKYLPFLDGIRGLAALMIMVFHFIPNNVPLTNFPMITYLQKMVVFGQTGVDLFFVLSGFLITRILISEKGENHFFRNFYIRRSLRIFPLYYFSLLLLFVITPIVTSSNFNFSTNWWFWVYLQNIPLTFNLPLTGPNHFWSLAVEEHFYLFWPLVVFFLNKKQLLRFSVFIIVMSVITRWIFTEYEMGVFYFTFCRLDAIALGAILAYYESENSLQNLKNILLKSFLLIIVLLVALWVLMSGTGNNILQIFKFTFIGYIYFCVLGLLIIYNNLPAIKVKKIFESKMMTFSGKISYGLYIYHPFCFLFVRNYLLNNSGSFIVLLLLSFALTFIVAWISYTFFESKILKLKDRYIFK